MVDYYNLLGVPPTASSREIQAAFRRRAKTVHPDAYPGLEGEEKRAVERRFIQLAQAYETLADPERRAAFDRKRRTTQATARGTSRATARSAGDARRPATGASRPETGAGGTAAHGARPAPGGTRTDSGDRPRQGPPSEGPDDVTLEELLQDVEELLGRFGLDLRQPFEQVLESLLDWARELFRGVMQAWEEAGEAEEGGHTARGASAAEKGTSAGVGHRRPEDKGGGAGGEANRAADRAAEERKIEAELEALKRKTRNKTN